MANWPTINEITTITITATQSFFKYDLLNNFIFSNSNFGFCKHEVHAYKVGPYLFLINDSKEFSFTDFNTLAAFEL